MARLLFIFLLGLTGRVLAQLPNARFDLLSNKDGLPSNTVNVAVEDERGFMWFGTRKNLTRYDGYTFQSIPAIGQVYGLATNRSGALYVSTQTTGQLLHLTTPSQPPALVYSHQEGGAYNTFIDSFGDVWFSDVNGIHRYEPATRKRHFYPMRKTTFVFHKGSFVEDADKNVWVLGFEVGLFRYDRKADTLRCLFGLDCPRPDFTIMQTPLRGGFFDRQGLLWIAAERSGIVRYNPRSGELKRFELPAGQCFSICPDTDDQKRPVIWVGTDRGIQLFRPDTETFQSFTDVLPVPFAVLSIYRAARTGIVWFCTTEGLLRYNPHNQAIQTNRIGNLARPHRIASVNGFLTDRSDPTGQTVWMAVAYNGLLRWNRRDNTTRLFRFPTYYGAALEANWLVQDSLNRIWVGGNQWQVWEDGKGDASDNRFEGIFGFDPHSETYLPKSFTVHHTFFSVPFYSLGLIDRRGRFWVVNHYEGVHVLDPATNRELHLWDKPTHDSLMQQGNWVMCLYEDRRGKLWLGTNQGLFYFDERIRQFVVAQRQFGTGGSVLDMTQDQAGNFWVVGWHSLAKLNEHGKVLQSWSEKDGLYDGECRRVAVDAQNRVWIGTYDGLHVLDEPKNTIRRLTASDGLLSNSTMAGLRMGEGDDLFVGSTGGWSTVNTRTISREKVANNLQLTSVRINNRESAQNWRQSVTLTHTENAVSFGFSAMNFLIPAYNYYAYFLDGFDKTWTTAGPDHQANYTNLPPGPYVFRVRATNEFDRQQHSTLAIPFTIRPAFYETWWFRLLLLLLLTGALAFVYQNRLSYRTIKARLALEEATLRQQEAKYNEEVAAYQLKLSQTEMAALRSQMNPHFIFNCLNSIQFFTAQNDAERASDYLAKFSRLIRLVLENSKSERVTLANELETLRLYIEMEAMRFPDKLHYIITVANSIDAESIQIPPLLLQPFVENAIWHGLMHKDDGGNVSVRVEQLQDDRLHVAITDDGVGRQQAAVFKSKSATRNKSFGMKLTAERIDLINKLYHTQTQVQVVDLTDESGRPIGTNVFVEIPI